ncbi:unnamed protein product [Dicrocoelium dendriticum]|nr:unnamed protein product [Dicrocoelium dendriticum]
MGVQQILFPNLSSLPMCIPRYYGGIVLTGMGSVALNMYFSKQVMKARKEHNVEYPLLYHPTNTAFNCIQRGHQNYLETLPLFLMLLFVGGLRFPLVGPFFFLGDYYTLEVMLQAIQANEKLVLFLTLGCCQCFSAHSVSAYNILWLASGAILAVFVNEY